MGEYSFLRRLLQAANDIAERVYEVPDDVGEGIDWAEVLIFDIARKRQAVAAERIDTLTPELVKEVICPGNPGHS